MTQEEKRLLLTDLCARLPYGVWGLHRGEDLPLYVIDNSGAYMVLGYNAWFNLETVPFKPYLRPMSSMTDKERQSEPYMTSLDGYMDYDEAGGYVDWLLAHHFDYHGLIPMGLALEAPEDMYKTE